MKIKILCLVLSIGLFAAETAYCREKLQDTLGEELIIYTCLTNGYWQLWAYNLETKVNLQITKDKADKKSPFYCKKENSILYRTPDGKLYSYSLETKEAKQLFDNIKYIADAKCYNGKFIFTRYRTDVKDDSDIWTIDLKDNKKQVLTQKAGLQYHPDLSKDGKKLAYVSGIEPGNHHIYIKNIASGKTKQLTKNPGYQILPVFSHNDRKLLFVSDESGNYDIWTMGVNGKYKKRLTDYKGLDSYPSWSLDGTKIVYAVYVDGKYKIMVMNKNGRNNELLFECNDSCSEPQWIKIKNNE